MIFSMWQTFSRYYSCWESQEDSAFVWVSRFSVCNVVDQPSQEGRGGQKEGNECEYASGVVL